MRDAFVAALHELAEQDPSVVLVDGDLGFGVLNAFIEKRPGQFINAGVAEQNMTAIACGMALEGARAYTYSIANFTTLRCLEQLRNDVCYHDANVTAVSIGGGFSYGQLGMSHFATEDLAIMRALPGMAVVAPSDPWQAAELTKQLYGRGGPTYLRIDKDKADLPPAPEEVFLGKVRVVREGADVTLFATGGILGEALRAAAALAAENISALVVDVHTIKPFDIDGVTAAAARTGVVVTIEEHNVIGGLGGAVAEACLEAGTAPRFFKRMGLKDEFPSVVGDQRYLRWRYGLDAEAIATVAREGVRQRG